MSAYYRLISGERTCRYVLVRKLFLISKGMFLMRRFRTFIITKRHLRAVCITAAAAVSAGIGYAVFKAPAALPAFSPSDGSDKIYEDILDAGLPHGGDALSLGDIISKIIGFDPDEPDSIIREASPVFDPPENEDSTEQNIPSAAPSDIPSAAPTETPVQLTENDLPSHEQIINSVGLKINNATNYDVNLDELCSAPRPVSLELNAPEVLIMHTHTTECFDGDAMPGESERTTDENYNVCAVGTIISEELSKYGIQSIHDTTIHDYPSYQGAYTRALETINKNMEEYPSIRVVLDVHRDAYIYNDGSKLKVSADINGESIAQVMLVLGTDSMNLYHPYWKDNLTLAAKIQNAAEIIAPGIMRPLNLRRERFNMHVTRGSILLEMGSNGNTLDEVKRSAQYIGKAIAAALLNG